MKEDMIDKSQELTGEIIGQDHEPLKEEVTERGRSGPPKGVINTITCRLAGGGTSYSSRKRHMRRLRSINLVERNRRMMSLIIFTDEDFKGIDPN